MNFTETHTLLELAQALDNRRFDDVTVAAWHAVLGDLPYADCAQAVVDHHRASTDYLLPAHVYRGAMTVARERQRVERERREAEEGERLAIGRGPVEDRAAEVVELVEHVRRSLPEPPKDVFRRPEVARWDRRRARPHTSSAPNPRFTGYPPEGGHPVPGESSA